MSNFQNNSTAATEKPKYEIEHSIANVFLLVMFTVFPLFLSFFTNSSFPYIHFDQGYFQIRHDKYYLFLVLTGIAFFVELGLWLTKESNKADKTKIKTKQNFLSKLSFTDWALISFLLICTISFLCSDYKEVSFFGEPNGRNNGLLLLFFYGLAYFIITRFYYHMEYVLAGLAGAAIIVYILSILNGFYVDPLQTLSQLSEHDAENFTSTIGNKNLLSSYICVALPVTVAMSVCTKKLYFRVLYLASSGIGFMSLMMSDSDSGILGFGAFSAVLLIVYSRKISSLKKYFLTLTIMFASAKVLRLYSLYMNDRYKEIGTLQQVFVFSKVGFAIIAVCGIITALLYLLDKKLPNLVMPKAVPIALGSLIGLAVISVIGVVYYYSTVDTTTDLGSLEKLIRFNDSWGTHRGFMWIRAMNIFGDASPIQKLFGTGPDTFYYPFSKYFKELEQYGDGSTNAAHNEYINYLITIGLLGLGAYLTFIGSAVVRAVKAAAKNPVTIAFIAGVVGYSAQAVVNIAQPITTPLFIVCVALCEAVSSREGFCLKESTISSD